MPWCCIKEFLKHMTPLLIQYTVDATNSPLSCLNLHQVYWFQKVRLCCQLSSIHHMPGSWNDLTTTPMDGISMELHHKPQRQYLAYSPQLMHPPYWPTGMQPPQNPWFHSGTALPYTCQPPCWGQWSLVQSTRSSLQDPYPSQTPQPTPSSSLWGHHGDQCGHHLWPLPIPPPEALPQSKGNCACWGTCSSLYRMISPAQSHRRKPLALTQ